MTKVLGICFLVVQLVPIYCEYSKLFYIASRSEKWQVAIISQVFFLSEKPENTKNQAQSDRDM